MITFNFDNGLIATLRTSGTEPKIKYYAELCTDPENSLYVTFKNLYAQAVLFKTLKFYILIIKQFFFSDVSRLKSVLNEMVEAIIEEFLKPHENSLIFRNN